MQPYLIESEHCVGKTGLYDWTARIENCADRMAAIEVAAECYRWAQGYPDHEAGVIWPFNPLMLVDGIPAYRVAAADLGGAWAEAAARKDAAHIMQVAA